MVVSTTWLKAIFARLMRDTAMPPANTTLAKDDLLNEDDLAVAQLLSLADEYANLQLEARKEWLDGHLNVSRANYSGLSKKYGVDSYDMRPYLAQTTVDIGKDGFRLEDSDEPEGQEELALRQRHTKTKTEPTSIKKRSPLAQFGVLVPPELTRAQSEFTKAVEHAITLANLQAQMVALVEKVDKQ